MNISIGGNVSGDTVNIGGKVNGGVEQAFLDLIEMLEDENYHSEASVIELVKEKLKAGRKPIFKQGCVACDAESYLIEFVEA